MSCTDAKTSPYACRDKYYVTLESSEDPPNSFKWLEASQELKQKMNLTFDDPRFMFNFVMTREYIINANANAKYFIIFPTVFSSAFHILFYGLFSYVSVISDQCNDDVDETT